MPTSVPDDLPVLDFADAPAWEQWLSAHHTDRGVWLRIARKAAGVRSVAY